jgi:hypothetical protein
VRSFGACDPELGALPEASVCPTALSRPRRAEAPSRPRASAPGSGPKGLDGDEHDGAGEELALEHLDEAPELRLGRVDERCTSVERIDRVSTSWRQMRSHKGSSDETAWAMRSMARRALARPRVVWPK